MMSDYSQIKENTKTRMEKTLETLRADFGSLRAGRAMPVCLTELWWTPTVQ